MALTELETLTLRLYMECLTQKLLLVHHSYTHVMKSMRSMRRLRVDPLLRTNSKPHVAALGVK